MRGRKTRIAIVAIAAIGIFATLAAAQPPTPQPIVAPQPIDGLQVFMRFGGFGTQINEVETWDEKKTLTERIEALEAKQCNCDRPVANAVQAIKNTIEYRKVLRQVRRCDKATGQCYYETVEEIVPVNGPVESSGGPVIEYGEPSDEQPSGPLVNQTTGLLYRANGRQKLFQPLRRWRLRFTTGRLFPNAWWNR